MHHDRSDDHGNSSAARSDAPHHLGDAADRRFHSTLRGDLVRHERESETIAILERRDDTNAGYAADHRIAGPQVAKLAARRSASADDDRGVHALLFDDDPGSI